MTAVLEVKNLTLGYAPGRWLCRGLSFSLRPGEMLGVAGLSGCGKSTLCLALSGIIPHSAAGIMEGDVYLLGDNTRDLTLPRIATRAGIVFQDPETQLFLPRIRHELAFGPENLCRPREEIAAAIGKGAALTAIEHLLPHSPNEISGGQQQLVALAAVLCLDPAVLILDEVASQLDETGGRRILEVIRLLKEQGKAVVMVDHNLERLRLADWILPLNDGICRPEPARDFFSDPAAPERCYGLATGEVP